MDFVHDRTEDGRSSRVLTVVDNNFSRECLALEADRSLSGERVAATLEQVARQRGYLDAGKLPLRHATLEMDVFHCANRPVDTEWQRRLDDEKAVLNDLAKMRRRVENHFARRYHGQALEEWLRDLFELPKERIQAVKGSVQEN